MKVTYVHIITDVYVTFIMTYTYMLMYRLINQHNFKMFNN